MLFELAIADAYSWQWNNHSKEFIQDHNDLSSYSTNTDDEIIPGYYTGITQLNIAIVKMVVLGHPWVKEFVANSFVVMFKRDPRRGYPEKLKRLLSQVANGDQLINQIDPYTREGNCTIRATPLGILSTPLEVIKATITQTAITNNNPDDFYGSIAISLMSHYFIYRLGKKALLKDFLDIYLPTEWLQKEQKHLTNSSLITSSLAIDAVLNHHSLSELLQSCIETMDNIHSNNINYVSAIAVAAASCSNEYEQDLPPSLVDNLETTRYGKNYLIELDRQLMTSSS